MTHQPLQGPLVTVVGPRLPDQEESQNDPAHDLVSPTFPGPQGQTANSDADETASSYVAAKKCVKLSPGGAMRADLRRDNIWRWVITKNGQQTMQKSITVTFPGTAANKADLMGAYKIYQDIQEDMTAGRVHPLVAEKYPEGLELVPSPPESSRKAKWGGASEAAVGEQPAGEDRSSKRRRSAPPGPAPPAPNSSARQARAAPDAPDAGQLEERDAEQRELSMLDKLDLAKEATEVIVGAARACRGQYQARLVDLERCKRAWDEAREPLGRLLQEEQPDPELVQRLLKDVEAKTKAFQAANTQAAASKKRRDAAAGDLRSFRDWCLGQASFCDTYLTEVSQGHDGAGEASAGEAAAQGTSDRPIDAVSLAALWGPGPAAEASAANGVGAGADMDTL